MKAFRWFAFCLILFAASLAHGWQPSPIGKKELANGLKLYFSEDRQLPLFQVTVFIRGGDVQDPVEKAGLADVTAHLLVTGGTVSKVPQAVDEWLDQRAIRLSAVANREWIAVTVTALADQWKESLDFLGEVLLEPRWDPERFQITMKRAVEETRRNKDQPESVLDEAFQHAIYGEKHPWGKTATVGTLKKIGLQDVKSFHQKYFYPNRMVWAVAGDFSGKKIGEWFEKWGKNLKPTSLQEVSLAVLPLETKPEAIKIRKKLTQDFIEVGGRALVRHAKEQYAFGLLQYILGGEPFTSRLSRDIRSRQALAYTVYSTWETSPVRGYYKIHVETRADAKEKVLASIRSHLQRLSEKADISAQEMAQAKQALLNKYIFWFASKFDYVVTKARLDMLGYPNDYLEKYPERLRGVSLKEMQEVAKNFIRPEELKVVIVGP